MNQENEKSSLTELLAEVWKVSPAEWKRMPFYEGSAIRWDIPAPGWLCPVTQVYLAFPDRGPFANAEAIIAMLDAMEKAGLEVSLYSSINPSEYWVFAMRDAVHLLEYQASSTRAEAVARAFVAVFRDFSPPASPPVPEASSLATSTSVTNEGEVI